jgi:signal transduction histidine kinase
LLYGSIIISMPELVTKAQLEQILATISASSDLTKVEGLDPAVFFQLLKVTQQTPNTASITRRHCAQGEIVFLEGEQGDTMYMVLAGRSAMLKGDLNQPTLLGLCEVGSIFGEMALLEDLPYSSTVIALEELSLLGINRKRFHQFVTEMPSLSIKIMEMLSLRLRATDEARASINVQERRLADQVLSLETEKLRLEELERLRQETTELIIHDLRNPLSAINLSLNTLALVTPDSQAETNRKLIDVAKMSVDHMRQLVDSLLEVSRIEAGEEVFNLAPADLATMIQDVVARYSLLKLKKINLDQQIEPGLPKIPLDESKISRVLLNLLDNAFRYTPENGQIIIGARRLYQQVQVNISDTGPGIPREQRERIFTRFAQINIDRPTRRGFGLGLAYCRLAVEAHGGRIWVEDGPGGRGSCFVFSLPVT